MIIQLTTLDGKEKSIVTTRFAALEGWELQRRFVEFAITQDPVVRRAFTLEVLSHAAVAIEDTTVPLVTAALVDNHLQTWENIQKVFEEVLRENGIDPDTHAEKSHYWAEAGQQMAVAFMAEVTQLVGPAVELLSKKE